MKDKKIRELNLDTICVQGGYQPKNGETRNAPIYQSTTYKYDRAETVGNLFDLKENGYFYTRLSNPTIGYLEEKIAQMEGGVAGLATSSGQAANLLAILTVCSQGDHIVSMNNLYGGTHTLLASTLARYGIESSFVSLNNESEIRGSIKENTKLIFSETIGNPTVSILDIEKVASIAHDFNLALIVDNTLATPMICRPIDFGADIVTHSTSKYLDGHGSSLGGVIIDSGNFDWTSGRYSSLTEPDPNYHGLSYTKEFGNLAYITKARAVYMRDMGPQMSPFNAFLTDIGSETLALRMERHSKNALKIASYLEEHEKVEWVSYPMLKSAGDYKLAKKYLKAGSGVIAFAVKGGVDKAKDWINSLELITLAVHVADTKSHALHPASMTHRQLSEEDLLKGGITPSLVRLSVGIENPDDLIRDIENAFNKIG